MQAFFIIDYKTIDKIGKMVYNNVKRLGDFMRDQDISFGERYDFRCKYHKSWRVETHSHEHSELLYCKSGVGVATVNGREIVLGAGRLIWLPPNYIHRYDFFDAEVICAEFSDDLVPLYFEKARGRMLYVTAVDMGELGLVTQELHLAHRNKSMEISGYLNLICSKVTAGAVFEEKRSDNCNLCQKVICYISENYTNDIDLGGVARKFGYNEKYLSHTLHQLTGVHFSKLLSNYRVERAMELLLENKEKSVSQIAAECGFSSSNTFFRAFKEATGKTPLEYRKQK